MSAATKETRKFCIEPEMTIYTAAEMKTQLMGWLGEGAALEMDLSRVGEMSVSRSF